MSTQEIRQTLWNAIHLLERMTGRDGTDDPSLLEIYEHLTEAVTLIEQHT